MRSIGRGRDPEGAEALGSQQPLVGRERVGVHVHGGHVHRDGARRLGAVHERPARPPRRAARAAPATSSTAPVAHDTCDSATRRVRGPLARATASSRSAASPSGSIRRITRPVAARDGGQRDRQPGVLEGRDHDLVAGAPVDAPRGHVEAAGRVGRQGDLRPPGAPIVRPTAARSVRRVGGRALEVRRRSRAGVRGSRDAVQRRISCGRGGGERSAAAGVEEGVRLEGRQLRPHGGEVGGHGRDRSPSRAGAP